jgi:hypothetical protein
VKVGLFVPTVVGLVIEKLLEYRQTYVGVFGTQLPGLRPTSLRVSAVFATTCPLPSPPSKVIDPIVAQRGPDAAAELIENNPLTSKAKITNKDEKVKGDFTFGNLVIILGLLL